LDGEKAVKKDDPVIEAVNKFVCKEYQKERTSTISDKELDSYVRKSDKKRHSEWKKSRGKRVSVV